MNQSKLLIRWRWLLAALLFIPTVARADPDYGGLYQVLLLGLAVVVLLLAGVLWIIVADYRAGRPGIGVINAAVTGVMLLGWLGATVQHWPWLTSGLMAVLGLNGWLLARKNLRVAAHHLPLWLALGVVGVGWLVGAVLGFWLELYPGGWQWLASAGLYVWPLLSFALQLPALLLLGRAFFTRWPTEWPAQTVTVSLQVAGIVAALDMVFYLAEVLGMAGMVGANADIWQANLLALLRSLGINLLEVTLVLVGLRWWQVRRTESVKA